MDDALAGIAGSEERDAPGRRVPAELVDLALDLGVGDASGRRACRHIVVRHGEGEIGVPDGAAASAKHLERVEGALVDEMAVDVQECPLRRARRDDVPRPDLVEHRLPRHDALIVRPVPRDEHRARHALTPLAAPAIVAN